MSNIIIIGRLGSAYGVRGWLKLQSFTQPITNILDYSPWFIQQQDQWQPLAIEACKPHGNGLIVKLTDCNDRDQAQRLTNAMIGIERSQLPSLDQDEYYWQDLEGLHVVTTEGVELGHIDHLFETTSNDVMVIQNKDRQRLLPYTKNTVQSIDIDNKIMVVDWDPDF